MNYQKGFTLIELMAVVAIIAILSSVSIPSYQRYMQKAAMTNTLQTISNHKTLIELCFLQQGGLNDCNHNSHGIPAASEIRYASGVEVSKGIISIAGRKILNGLSIVLTPTQTNEGNLNWTKSCQAPTNPILIEICEAIF